MKKVIYSSIMKHIETTINNKEISDLHKDLYRIVPRIKNIDEFDLMIIDKLIYGFNFDRLANQRAISLTQFVSDLFLSPGYLEYAFVLKRLLNISGSVMTNRVDFEGAFRSYTDDNFEKYIASGPELKHNVIIFNRLIDGFEFKLTENDVILTLTINMNHIDFLRSLNHI